jgi:hypothetical protein
LLDVWKITLRIGDENCRLALPPANRGAALTRQKDPVCPERVQQFLQIGRVSLDSLTI